MEGLDRSGITRLGIELDEEPAGAHPGRPLTRISLRTRNRTASPSMEEALIRGRDQGFSSELSLKFFQ